MGNAVDPQSGIGRQFKLTFNTAIGIGRQGLGINLLILGIINAHSKALAGK